MRRSDSGTLGSEPNLNTEWISGRGFWFFYAGLLVLAYWVSALALGTFVAPSAVGYAWSLVNIVHAVVTFYIMHWLKGVPFWFNDGADQGRYDKDTFWEQIDGGRQFTRKRKLFSIVPLILFVLAVYDLKSTSNLAWLVNFGFAMLGFIPKLDSFHHVRIAGINRD